MKPSMVVITCAVILIFVIGSLGIMMLFHFFEDLQNCYDMFLKRVKRKLNEIAEYIKAFDDKLEAGERAEVENAYNELVKNVESISFGEYIKARFTKRLNDYIVDRAPPGFEKMLRILKNKYRLGTVEHINLEIIVDPCKTNCRIR